MRGFFAASKVTRETWWARRRIAEYLGRKRRRRAEDAANRVPIEYSPIKPPIPDFPLAGGSPQPTLASPGRVLVAPTLQATRDGLQPALYADSTYRVRSSSPSEKEAKKGRRKPKNTAPPAGRGNLYCLSAMYSSSKDSPSSPSPKSV